MHSRSSKELGQSLLHIPFRHVMGSLDGTLWDLKAKMLLRLCKLQECCVIMPQTVTALGQRIEGLGGWRIREIA